MTNAVIDFIKADHKLVCSGDWTTSGLVVLLKHFDNSAFLKIEKLTIDASNIQAMDTAGAWILRKLTMELEANQKPVTIAGLSEEHQALYNLVKQEAKKTQQKPKPLAKHFFPYFIGKDIVFKYLQLRYFLGFLGEVSIEAVKNICNPRQFQWRAFLNVIEQTGFRALPIVALLSFSIGVVLAYQLGQQLKVYGANIYIVSLMGVGVLQEFAPLITAIIVAGRTSSAFTAEIGAMKINEEIDALRTMGLSPINRLVIPKIAGLMVSLPLLVVWAGLFGLLGGMVVAKSTLDIGYYNFIQHFPEVVELSTFMNGIIKAPFFAAIIANVGCFQGFQVKLNADSLGKQTTKSVVQAIFLIVIADAIFSIIMSWQAIS